MVNICRIGVVRNEEDIIERNLRWYIDQGFPTIILDNGSTDRTYDICQSYLGKGIVDINQITFQEHDRELSLKELGLITQRHGFEWLLLADVDEFYESPIPGESLRSSLSEEIGKAYNIVQFHNMEFWMTDKDRLNEPDPIKRINHYSYFDSNRYKLFPNVPGIDFWTKLGHVPILPSGIEYTISSKIHISRHYKFRSIEQGLEKISRIRPSLRRKDTSFHYAKFTSDESFFIIPYQLLNEYHEDGNWNLNRTFDGHRMNKQEMMSYLRISNEDDFQTWMKSRGLGK
ncbi:MAG: glycosyltransferase family 2 protein [Candidatus Woesearchaeota archaeon]